LQKGKVEGLAPFPSCNPAILQFCNVMNVLIGVISPAAAWVMPRQHVDRLRSDFPHHTFLDAWDRDALRRLLPAADVAFTPFVDRDVFASASRLRWVQSPAVGVGSLMFPELLASPVILTSARGIRARSMAEHVLGVTIALARLLPASLRAQASHRWAQEELEAETRTLYGQCMGIVGLGAIGLEVVKIAAPFGFRITAIRRRAGEPPPQGVEAVWTPDRLPDLLAQSDVVVLAAPHTPETKRLLGRAQIDRMKRGALLVNVARGKLVDDEALVEALRAGRIGGAALDVFSQEPLDPSSPYWDLPNVIVTPHTSGAMQDYWTPLVALFADNLRRFEKGEPLLNVVDKVAGY
jgi:phosphoglycerate dehydrogenase-like enzyme